MLICMLSASVKFDFDICSLKEDLLRSVETFEIGNELGSIVDHYIAPKIGGTILDGNPSVVDEIKTFISSQAHTVTNAIKRNITSLIERISCVHRRMDKMEIGQDGSQRLLQSGKTFASLVEEILLFDGVESATAGLDLARMEVGLDVAIRVENPFNGTYFQSALDDVFERLAPIQAVFGAEGKVADVGDLLNKLNVNAVFQLSFSAGAKVDMNVTDFFKDFVSNVSNATPNLTGYLRIEKLAALAVAGADDISLELFQNFNISKASMALELGVELLEPFEIILDSSYIDLGIGFHVGQLRFEPYGTLAASFPFSATFGNITQRFEVSFAGNDLFDKEEVTVTIDYDACRFLDVFEQLLGKLGAMTLSPQNVLGPTPFRSIDLDSLDSLFPSVGGFLVGVLEGEWTMWLWLAFVALGKEGGGNSPPPPKSIPYYFC